MEGDTFTKAQEIRRQIARLDQKIAIYKQPFCNVLDEFWHDSSFKISEKNHVRDELREKILLHYYSERVRLEAEFSSL